MTSVDDDDAFSMISCPPRPWRVRVQCSRAVCMSLLLSCCDVNRCVLYRTIKSIYDQLPGIQKRSRPPRRLLQMDRVQGTLG